MSITVDYNVERQGIEEELTFGQCTAVKIVRCAWVDRITLMREVLGYFDSQAWHLPDLYDTPGASESLNLLYAHKATSKPYDEDRTEARVTILYKTQEFQQISGNNVYVTESLESATEFLTLDRKGLYLGSGSSRVNLSNEDLEAPAVLNCMVDWVYTLHRVSSWAAANFDLAGKVNHAAVYSRGLDFTFPAGTLLCRGPVTRREVNWDGSFTWKITYRFTFKNQGTIAAPRGWNWWPDTTNATAAGIPFVPLTNEAGVAVPIFPTANFSGVIL
jgi:hypothetical protein